MEPQGVGGTLELFCILAVVNRRGGIIEDFSWGSIKLTSVNEKPTPPEEPLIVVRSTSYTIFTAQYNLVGNIEGIFTRFINYGRATVCLKEPSYNIIITKAFPIHLSAFIAYVNELLPADSPVNVSTFALEPPTPQLYLTCQEEYKLRMENIIRMNLNLDQFTYLNISNCILELIGYQLPIVDAIRKMQNLTSLQLGGIKLYSSTFLEIESTELKQLHLCYCENRLQIELFNNNPCYKDSLIELRFEGNQWAEIPNGIFEFRNLLTLSLNDNCLTQLPDKFTNLPKLQELKLSFNRLTHLPPSIFEMPNLLKIILLDNCITELSDKFANLSKLEYLSLSGNELRFVPPCIFQLQNLSVLSLSNNFITELPDKFTNLPKLQYLSLSNNPLQYLPPSIFSLYLMHLEIRFNAFNFEIPPAVGSEVNLHSLKELSYRAILNHELKVEEGMLPKKCLKDLENHHQCVCGCKFVDEGQDWLFSINLNDISRIIRYDGNGILTVPVRGKMCNSLKSCFLDRFTKCK